MYISEFHAHVVIRSKSRRTWLDTPGLTFQEMSSARYVLFNNEAEKLTYPLRLEVFKSRVEFGGTDFFASMKNEYPSIEHIGPLDPRVRSGHIKKECVIIHDEFDIIKFLLLYGD